ncbi:MAG: HAMP domain-containing protein [Deltaproteobacteria bacterium]|jgi:two-component system nitrogen regulation sensor histidine kinase NtrY|nr:HAMP domain-containing protein [Deltaproteobacteria bacterium]
MPDAPLKPKDLPPETLKRKKVFERSLIILSLLSLILLTVVQRKLLNLGPGLSSSQGVITLVSINVSVLVLGLLLFLILRGLYRIYFERRSYGSLQTKMVVSFISLSLLPTLLTFYFSYLLIGQNQDTWFSSSIRRTFEDALAVSEYAQELDRRLTAKSAEEMAERFEEQAAKDPGARETWPAWLAQAKQSLGLQTAELYSPEGRLIARSAGAEGEGQPLESAPPLNIKLEAEAPDIEAGRVAAPWLGPDGKPLGQAVRVSLGGAPLGWLAVSGPGREAIQAKAADISQGLASHRVAVGISQPFRVAQMTSLAGVTLLAVFLSIWIGSHLAGSLASPITELVEGTRRVAKGDLDFELPAVDNSGEMVHLVDAFNQMTRDLKASYSELDRRRRFFEAILKQVSSGVLIFDLDSNLINLNQVAVDLLKLDDFSPGSPRPAVIGELLEASPKRAGPAGHAFAQVGEETLSLTIRRAPLLNEEGRPMGFLITFDDLSELEKAQRLAAWREVARRIAHEIKNPLTPISLSAQRLRRRFGERLSTESDAPVFDECTAVIIRQVENMRRLVSEFSEFARLPEISPRPANLVKVAEEALALFRSAHAGIKFGLKVKKAPDTFIFDPEQIGRVITNLLANSAAAISGSGRVDVTVDLDELTGVSLTVSDDGPGLSPELKDKIFEPYVTTGPEGRGLGLPIVVAIVRDHGGFIRVADNAPTGTSFIVTIPYRRV